MTLHKNGDIATATIMGHDIDDIITVIESLVIAIHTTACVHGFHEVKHTSAHMGGLIMTEVAEYIEADRHGEDVHRKAEELADTIIRCLDTAGAEGLPIGPAIINKMIKNDGRAHKHGKAY